MPLVISAMARTLRVNQAGSATILGAEIAMQIILGRESIKGLESNCIFGLLLFPGLALNLSEDSKTHPRRNRPNAGGALRVQGGGVGLHHQLRHQVPDGTRRGT